MDSVSPIILLACAPAVGFEYQGWAYLAHGSHVLPEGIGAGIQSG
jgi:hypothetical protein